MLSNQRHRGSAAPFHGEVHETNHTVHSRVGHLAELVSEASTRIDLFVASFTHSPVLSWSGNFRNTTFEVANFNKRQRYDQCDSSRLRFLEDAVSCRANLRSDVCLVATHESLQAGDVTQSQGRKTLMPMTDSLRPPSTSCNRCLSSIHSGCELGWRKPRTCNSLIAASNSCRRSGVPRNMILSHRSANADPRS